MTQMRPVPVDRQLGAEGQAQAELGDDLLWILPDPEDGIGSYPDDRLSIRPQVAQDDHLGRCLGRRVGVSWIERRVLSDLPAQDLPIHLVCAHVDEAGNASFATRFEQRMGPQRVRDREGQRVAERIVDEALGCEMDDEIGVANDAPAEVAVTDVPDDEAHPVPVDEVGDIVHVPRVRQLVEDREPRPGEDLSQVLGYVGADEPAAPSHHDLRHCIVSGSNDHRIGKILWSFVIDARRLETAVAWTSALSHSVPRVAPWGDGVAAGKSFLNKQLWYAASVPRQLRHDAPWPHW